MSGYKKVNYGYLSDQLMDPSILKIAGMLKSYLLASKDKQVRIDYHNVKEVIEYAKLMIGKNFKGFLTINYDNGRGVRSSLVRGIVLFLNGKINGRTLLGMIKVDENYVSVNDLTVVQRSSNKNNQSYDEVIDYLANITERDFYALLVGVGPVALARMLLTFMGDSVYVRK